MSYIIPLQGLKEGEHEFEFRVESDFFEKLEESEIKSGQIDVTVILVKRTRFCELEIKLDGEVTVQCDRCLDDLSVPVEHEDQLVVKYDGRPQPEDPNVIMLKENEYEFDLSQQIYEFVICSLPYQRVHPDDEEGNSLCNSEMLKKLDEHIVEGDDEETDPIWDELKGLIN